MALPEGLDALFPPGHAVGRELDVVLPPGRVVYPDGGVVSGVGAYWLSEVPVDAGVWQAVRAAHDRSGLWPVLLEGQDIAEPGRWAAGRAFPQPLADVDGVDVAGFVRAAWDDWDWAGVPGEKDYGFAPGTSPFGPEGPTLAPAGVPDRDPGVVADRTAGRRRGDATHLGLVAAERSADVVTVAGWCGGNLGVSAAEISAFLRDWERRFGARLVELGSDTMVLSVAWPPRTFEHALQVAAEHWALAPDNLESGPSELPVYAEHLRDNRLWDFWWD